MLRTFSLSVTRNSRHDTSRIGIFTMNTLSLTVRVLLGKVDRHCRGNLDRRTCPL